MKFSMKMAVLSMAGVLALGGAATAASFIFEKTSTGTQKLTTDSALIMNWQDTEGFSDVSNLDNTTSQFRYITLDWSKSAKATGKIILKLELTDNSQSITVDVSTKNWGADFDEKDILYTLSTSELASTEDSDLIVAKDFEVADLSSDTTTTTATYYLRISMTGEKSATDISAKLVATLRHENA